MILQRLKVKGHSMEPIIRFNDEVIVSSIPYLFKEPKLNDIVAFEYTGKILIKRIKDVKGSKFIVEGDNKKDTLSIGWIKKSDIIGKIILKL